MDLDDSGWPPSLPERGQKLERCLFGKEEVLIPEAAIEQRQIFADVMSLETWNTILTEAQRKHLMTLLPEFPEDNNKEKLETIRRLLSGENFKFGNPLKQFQKKLKDGYYYPDIAKYASLVRQVKTQEYKYRQQMYYSNLLKDILLSRQRVFEQLSKLPPDEPIKFEYVIPKQPKKDTLEQKVKRKYHRLLREVRQECGEEETSSEEDDGSPVQRSKKQLFKSLCPIPSPEPTTPSVLATFAAKPPTVNGDAHAGGDGTVQSKRPRPISPVEITEDDYRDMLVKHKQLKKEDEEKPELNTQNITLQDIMNRCQASKKGVKPQTDQNGEIPSVIVKKKLKSKERLERKFKKKPMRKPTFGSGVGVPSVVKTSPVPEKIPVIKSELPDSMDEDEEEAMDAFAFQEAYQTKPVEYRPKDNFFSLLRDFIKESPDKRITSAKLEEKVREWQESPASSGNIWFNQQPNWVDVVVSALKFLAGNTIGMSMENFIPYLDFKERAQQWRWIGEGRDPDESMSVYYQHWLHNKEEATESVIDSSQGSPPPARSKTGFVVRPTTTEEKQVFQEQEQIRFDNPHKAFTYVLHGYESVVGPVKGIYTKDNNVTKAREHALLVSSRPAFVTILTLVRDAAARLPNGEGTRGDICELLKDSQFLAPGVTDQQINVVVSGALDRLHSEKDPCVRYDVNRKLWIYLHRCRTEDEFEKIHQAQGAAVKAKKSLNKPKAPKAQKLRELTQQIPPASSSSPSVKLSSPSTLKLSSSLSASSESLNVEDLSPLSQQAGSQAQQLLSSPSIPSSRTQSQATSPRTSQASPKAGGASAAAPSLRQVIGNLATTTATASTGTTQSLSPAQLQLLQQAAQAQAQAQAAQAHAQAQAQAAQAAQAQAKAQAQAQATAAQVQAAQAKAKAQAQAAAAQAQAQAQQQAMASTPSGSSPSRSPVVPTVTPHVKPETSTALLKNISQILQGRKPASPVSGSPQSPNIVIGSKPELIVQQQASLLASQGQVQAHLQGQGRSSPIITSSTASPITATVGGPSTPTPVNVSQAQASNPLVARLVQQMSGGQVVSVSNLLAAQRLQQQQQQQQQQQGQITRTTQAVKVQGSNVVPVGGGKPIHLAGKPLAQAKGQIVQLGGKGQHPLGLLTPQGTISIIPQTGSGGVVTISQPRSEPGTPDNLEVSSELSAVQTVSVSQTKPAPAVAAHPTMQVISQGKPGAANQGIVVTQLAPGGLALRHGGPVTAAAGQGKLVTQGQAGLVPAQFVLQSPVAAVKSENQATGSSAPSGVQATPVLMSNTGGKPGQNLQVVRTVLSQQAGLKPGQATILISQPALQQGGAAVLPPGQVMQGAAKVQGKVNPRGKTQPVFARIISPTTGVRFMGAPAPRVTQIQQPTMQTIRQPVPAMTTVTMTGAGATVTETQQVIETIKQEMKQEDQDILPGNT